MMNCADLARRLGWVCDSQHDGCVYVYAHTDEQQGDLISAYWSTSRDRDDSSDYDCLYT